MPADREYRDVIVESFEPTELSGLHGKVHIRPLAGQGLDTRMLVECSKSLSKNYRVGTIFKIRAKITDRQGGKRFLYSNYRWKAEVMTPAKAADFLRRQKGAK